MKKVTISKGNFVQAYQCECGTFFFKSPNGDDKKKWGCCEKCGRATTNWKVVSGRFVNETTVKKFLWMMLSVKVKTLSFEPSEFPQL